jgi:hypothetical protein
MNSNPILEEIWRIKDELAREADGDLHRLCENTRRWVALHPHNGPVVRSAEELVCDAQGQPQRTLDKTSASQKI